jgi:hypothetical protein
MNVVGDILMIPGDKVLTIGKDMIVVATDAVQISPTLIFKTNVAG